MKTKLLQFATLLMSGICFAQSDPTTFTNSNQPNPEPQSNLYFFKVVLEDGKPVGACPPGVCRISVNYPYGVAITLPDIPNQHVNHETIACTITKIVITGKFGCPTARCQSLTLTATRDNDGDSDDATCKDADGRVWKIVTTQYYHWRHSGRYAFQHYDGGQGTISH